MAIPVAFLSARRVTRNVWRNYCGNFIVVSSPSVNTLIWALFFVVIFGRGALPELLTIGFHSIGITGILLSEALDEAHPGTIEALQATGAPWLANELKSFWPQVKPAFWAIVLFSRDINVRGSVALGLVGAGDVGMAPIRR